MAFPKKKAGAAPTHGAVGAHAFDVGGDHGFSHNAGMGVSLPDINSQPTASAPKPPTVGVTGIKLPTFRGGK